LLVCGATNWDIIGRKTAKPPPTGIPVQNLYGPHVWGEKIRVRTIASACTACHSALITEDGRVMTWGRNETGQVSHILSRICKLGITHQVTIIYILALFSWELEIWKRNTSRRWSPVLRIKTLSKWRWERAIHSFSTTRASFMVKPKIINCVINWRMSGAFFYFLQDVETTGWVSWVLGRKGRTNSRLSK